MSPKVIRAVSLIWQKRKRRTWLSFKTRLNNDWSESFTSGESLRQKPHRTPLRKKASVRLRSAEFSKTLPGTDGVCQLGDDDCLVDDVERCVTHSVSSHDTQRMQNGTHPQMIFNTWSVIDNLLLTVTPSIFIELTRVIPSTSIGNCDVDFRLLLVKTISTDFDRLRVKLLVEDHDSMLFNSYILVSALHAGLLELRGMHLQRIWPLNSQELWLPSPALITYVTGPSADPWILADVSNKLDTSLRHYIKHSVNDPRSSWLTSCKYSLLYWVKTSPEAE